MAKVTLTRLTSANQPATINANYDAIEAGFDLCAFLDGTAPNTWQTNQDMNGNKIINLAPPTADTDAATRLYVIDTAAAAIGIPEADVQHGNILGIGTNTHAQIDTFLGLDHVIADEANILEAGFHPQTVALVDAATVTPDMDLGNWFTWTMAGDRTLGNISLPTGGNAALAFIDITNSGAARTLTLDTNYNLVVGTYDTTQDAVNRVWLFARSGSIIDVYIDNLG